MSMSMNNTLLAVQYFIMQMKRTIIANNLYFAPEEEAIEEALPGVERSASVGGSVGFSDSGSKSTNGKRTGVFDLIHLLLYG